MNRFKSFRPLGLTALCCLCFASILAQPCNTVASTIGTENTLVFATVGSSETQLDLFYLTGSPQTTPIVGSLAVTDPTSAFSYRVADAPVPTCAIVAGVTPFPYDAYVIVPDRSGPVRFGQDASEASRDATSLTLFREAFVPAENNCPRIVASTFTPTSNVSSFVVDLVAGETYVLVVLPGQDSDVTDPRSYQVFVENPADDGMPPPTLYAATPLAPDYAYTYLAIDAADTVRAASPVSDFRTLPAGDYTLRGVNYDTTTLEEATFVNQAVNDLPGDDPGNPACLRLSGGDPLAVTFLADAATPVDWLSFRAEAQATGVYLTWEVASETDNDYFRVERSPDGSQWSDIGEVAGNGTTQAYARFAYTDTTPGGGTNFYQLVQVDFDGTEHRSTVVRAGRTALTALQIFPNPFADQLTVRAPAAPVPGEQPRLYDVRGSEVTGALTQWVEGPEARLDTSTLPAGVYLLRWAGLEVRVVRQ